MSAKLIMKQVTKNYGDGDTTVSVLNNLNLIVNEGNSLLSLDLREQGKSTFLSAAGALLTPTSGEIFIDGESLTDKSKSELTELRLEDRLYVPKRSTIALFEGRGATPFVAKQGK